MEKVIDAREILLKDVAWGIKHLPYGYQLAVNERTYKFLARIPKDDYRVVIDNTLSDYVVKFEEVKKGA